VEPPIHFGIEDRIPEAFDRASADFHRRFRNEFTALVQSSFPSFSPDHIIEFAREISTLIAAEICPPISQTATDIKLIQFSKAIDSELKATVEAVSEQFKKLNAQSAARRDHVGDMRELQAAIQSLAQSHRVLSAQSLRELSRMKAEADETLAAAIAARKMVEARACQLRIQTLELEGTASRQREAIEATEQQKSEIAERRAEFWKQPRQPGVFPGWQKFMTALERLQARLDDDWCAELQPAVSLVERELREVVEQIRDDLVKLHVAVRTPRACREKREELPLKNANWLPEMAMAKLTRMRKEREAVISKRPSLMEQFLASE
jgi:hypothetical protein